MEQSNIGFCHFEPSLAGFVNEMECQVSGDTSQRPSNIAGNSGGLAQQTLNTIFENSEFSNENHFDHHHHHPNFPVTSTQFFMSGEMFGMSSSSNSSVFNFPTPSFLSQADLSRVYPFIQRGTAMQGLLSSTMDPHHHHHHHHHPHLPHQLTHSIFPMHRFPDLLNANPEVLPTLNFHSDIRGSAPFFKPAMQFSVHQQQQNILKLPTLPSTCAPNVITNSSTPSTSSSAQPTSSLQNVMPPKPVEVSPSSSTPSGGNCDQGIIKHSMNSNLIPNQRHDVHRNMEDNNASGNMSSPILKFSEGSKIFPGDFLAFQKAHQSNSSDHLSNHNRMSLISPNAMEANKMNNLHFQPRALDAGMASTAPSEDDGIKSRKSNKSNKQKHQRANNNSNNNNNNGCNNSVMNESCMNQMLAVQVSTGGAEIKSQVDFDEGDKNVDIVNTILQLVNDDKAEEIDQPEHLSGISSGRDGDGTKDVEFFDGRLQDSNSNSASQQQLHSMIPQHSIKVDSLVQVEESQCIMVDNQKRWKCSQCPKMYSTKHNLITHMLGHKGIKPHFCSLCGKYFKQVSHLHTHMLTHGKIKPHTCPVCFRSFTQSCHVKRHMVIHQQDKTHACNICGRNFAYPNDLKKHLQKHEEGGCMQEPETPKRTDDGDDDDNETRRTPASSKRQILKLHAIQNGLKCDQCPLSFESKDKLLNHRALEHRDTYACAECDKVFAYPSQLKHHASKHNNIRPFICRECGENFMKEHHLKAHMFTHTGLKPYDCTTCGRAFNQKANLRRHTLIHEAQKKFACDVCGKMFTQLQILRAHLITHREQKPFQCKICDKRFSRLHNLNGHMHLHGGERPYVCSCGSSFTLKGNLNRHKKDKNCQPIEMIELDEIDTKPIFDAIAVDTVTMETDKGAGSSGDDRRDGADGSKKKRKSVPRKSVAREAGGDSENKKEEENDSSTWQEKRDDDDYEDDDGSAEEEEIKTERQPNDYIELLTVKEYLFDKADDNEGDKFSSSNFPFQGVMYNHEPSTDQSMQFLSFASDSTNCSAANRDESDRADDSADKDLSTTDDEYDYDESSLMPDEKPRLNLS